MGTLAAPSLPDSGDRLVLAILAAQIAALRDRVESDDTVDLLWRATEVLPNLSGLVRDLGRQVGGSNPVLAEQCAAAVAAEAEISRLIGGQAFVQAQQQDFTRQVADCIATALDRLAAQPSAGHRFTADDLAALYVCEEQRAVHEVVTRRVRADTAGNQPIHRDRKPVRRRRSLLQGAAAAWTRLLAAIAPPKRPSPGDAVGFPSPTNAAPAAIDDGLEHGDTSDVDRGLGQDLWPSASATHVADAGAPEIVNRGTARDMETAMGLFGAAILDQVNTSVQTVLAENEQMRAMAKEMASASSQAKDQFKVALTGSADAESAIEQLYGCSSELTGSITVIGSEVRRSIAIVRDGTAQADVTKSCVETMAVLATGVIEVVEMIDRVAFQSRILALNAAVQAAHAGEAGKGFAVVAQEMNQLSLQTSEATQIIKLKISQMTHMVTQSVASLQTLVTTIGSVDLVSATIGHAITEQVSLDGRVSSSLDCMRSAVVALSREIREAAQLAANGGMLSEMVLETANSVDEHMGELKAKLDNIGAGLAPPDAGAALDMGKFDNPGRQGLAA